MSSIVPLEGEQLDARPTDIFRSKHEGKVSVSQEDASGVKRSPSQYDVIHGGASVSQDEVTRNGESVSQDEATRSGESVSQDKATRSGEPVSQDEATRSGEPVSQNEATRSGVSVSQNEATRSGESVFRIDAIRGREPVSPDVAHGRDRLVSQDDAIKNKESIPKDVAHGSDGSVSQGIVLSSSAQALSSVHYPLAHWELLGKRFQDYKQSCPFLMIPQQKEGLLSLLPLFMQACEQTAGVLCLPDITLMASDLGTLLAVEMRKRISNKPAGAARLSLTSFLLGAEEGMSGHLLLRSVHLLSQTNQDIRGCLIKTGLPDVFLQSLYLFLAFPPGQGGLKDLLKSETLVQDIFVQIMLSLCSQVQGVDEISRSSEFDCLLKAAASGWDRCDVRWTDAVHKVLRAMSNALSPGVVQYLHTSRCIPRFLQTLSQQVSAIPPTVLYQITNILLSFLTHSYPISPSLIQDFDDTQGYPLLLKILLRCEGEADSLITGHLDDLLSFLSALVICGKSEVKVSGQVLHPQLPGFSVGRTTGSGRTVKNLQAFQVLQSAFQSSVDALLCGKLLSAMQNIWAMEHCNFFLLEWSLQPITQFVEILPLKPPAVHLQFFQLIQYVVSDLSFIPHQTLHKLQEMIKQNQSPACTLEALRLLQSIIPISALFCDLFRDSGLLGMLLTQLRNHAKALRRAAGSALTGGEGECDRGLTIARLQTVGFLIQASVRNVVIIKDYGMIPYIKIFLDDMGFRKSALFILEHLSDIDPDEYMSTVMGALCSSTQAEITLKMDLLKSLQQVLRSPRERACFRNAAGFDVLLSLLSDMEGSLCCPPAACWSNVQPFHILRLIRATLAAMSAALCQDTINQHFVQSHEVFQKMAEDLMQLGCFCHPKSLCLGSPGEPQSTRTLHEILRLAVSTQSTCPQSLRSCFIILSLLLDMATGTLSRCGQELNEKETTIELPMMVCKDTQEVQTEDEFQQFVEDLFDKCPESFRGGDTLTVEPGALCVIISLIQSAYSEDTELSKEFQCAVLEVIHSLGRSERQRQVLSESQLLGCIAKFCRETLGNYGDPLRLPLVRLFEKLACQAVHPDVLRMFLCCSITKQNNPEVETGPDNPHSLCLLSGSILHTSMSLVSMTSPRRFQMHAAAMSPSFVEFDMASHGYGAAFLPTIATVLGSNVEEMLTGGVGPGVRSFPPPGGLSLSCWFMVNRFCLAPDPHPVRFLTIVRHASRSQQHYVCLSISLNAVEGSLVISTEEQEFQPLDMMEVDLSPCDAPRPLSQVCLNVSGHVVTEQWHHLSVVLKEVKRSCVVSAWIDGQVLGSAEMRYIQRLPGGISSLDPFSLVDIHAYLGTPRMWRQRSPLLWRLGPSHLFEEVLSEEMLCQIQRLGPSYCGSFSNGVISPALSEEKVNFGVSVLRSCISTISQIREMYNDVDGRHVAKELGVTSRDNCTPIFLARNLVSDVLGAARTLGAVTIQSDGVRIFHSSPAADALNYIGGPAVILGLVSMATDDQALYAAIKALVSVLSSSVLAEQLMHRIDGHRLLGFLLTQKSHLLNPRIFQLLLSITGTAEVGVEPAPPLNLTALENILCNFQLWLEVPGDLDIALLTHLEDILRCPREASITQHVQLVPRLVYLLSDPRVTQAKVNHICSLIKLCLCCDFNRRDITSLGLFLVSLLPTSSVDEKQTNPQQDLSMEDLVSADSGVPSGRMIWLRNQLLRVLISMMCPPTSSLSEQQQEQMLVTLGADWFLLFVQPSIHHSSIVLGMRLVGQLLQSPNLLVRFKQMAKAGACVENCTKDRNIMMDNLRSHPSLPAENFSLVSGFSALHEAICQLVDWPQIYVHVSSILLRSLQGLESSEGALDVMLHDLFQHHNSVQILRDGLCMEAALLLLTMVKAAMSQEKVSIGTSEALKFSNSVMQLLCLVYQSYPHDPLWITADFIQKLAALLILPVAQELCDSVSEEVPSGTEKLLGEPDKQQVQSARKPVQELLHLILRQSLTQIIAVKQHHPLEYLLETSPAESSLEQRNQFQTEILQCTMKMFHALSHREERSGQRAIHDPAAGAEILEETAIANLTYFSQKLLDKLYCGVFTADPCEILLFFIKQITTVTHVTAPCNREGLFSMLYSCLNRSILHCLSRSRQTLTGILRLLRVFRLLLSHWDVIFTTYNSSLNFAACLMHCLFQIYAGSYPEGFGLNTKCRGSSWQMIFLSKNEDEEQVTEGPGLQEVYSQVLQVVHAVWEQLMVHRRQVLEEHFKMDLSIKQSEGLIFEVTPLWEETASKAWQQYLTSEKKNLKSKSRPLAGTGQKISAAVRGLYGGNEQEAELKAQDVASILDKSRRSAQEVFKCLHRDHLQMQQCKLMAACRDWSALEEELISEVGVWRPLCSRRDQRWELSPYEGPWRVRMRMQPSPRKLETLVM